MDKIRWCTCSMIIALAPAIAAEAIPENYYQVITDSTHGSEPGYKPEFGYSVLVQFEQHRVLFDTGVTPRGLRHNLDTAGIDPGSIDVLVLSHNHPDHIGGISYIREKNPDILVYAAPEQKIDDRPVTRLSDVVPITSNLYVIRTHTDSPTSGISDELSLVLKTGNGLYVLTACSHTGVARILAKAVDVTGQQIFHYTGGARLKFRRTEDTQKVAAELNRLNVSQVSPGHCSVDHAVEKTLHHYFDGPVLVSVQGRRVALPAPDKP